MYGGGGVFCVGALLAGLSAPTLVGAPQFEQKPILVGTGVPQLVHAWVMVCAIIFFLFGAVSQGSSCGAVSALADYRRRRKPGSSSNRQRGCWMALLG